MGAELVVFIVSDFTEKFSWVKVCQPGCPIATLEVDSLMNEVSRGVATQMSILFYVEDED